MPGTERFEDVIVGGGHNGLVAAALLARAGRSVVVLEREDHAGGAAVSGSPFPGVDVRLSRYAYLVSLFPRSLLRRLGIAMELRRRRIAHYAPPGLLVGAGEAADRESMTRATGDAGEYERWRRFYAMCAHVAGRVLPTMLEPLRSRAELRRLVGDEAAWTALFEQPLSETLEQAFASDLVRGVALTDGLIGTFASASDPELRQNRCFLYHVLGGSWDVPVGGMGALSEALLAAARGAGAEVRLRAPVVAVATDGAGETEVECAGGARFAARQVLANVAPAVLDELLGLAPSEQRPEGSQLKLNLLLRRLPRLRDAAVSPADAFTGTFHVAEGYAELERAYASARDGQIPDPAPCECYCHSLTDPSILPAPLRDGGAHTLTAFALHMPARLFDRPQAKDDARRAVLRSLDSTLAEPIEECLWDAGCIEVLSPPELEAELGMPGGHIFHRDLAWPFAETDDEVGSWGVETAHANVWLCGAGARRGGGVSGIAGHNAARAVLATEAAISRRSRSSRASPLRG